MCLLDRCCCCCRLRTGVYVIGALSIAVAVLNIAVGALVLHLVPKSFEVVFTGNTGNATHYGDETVVYKETAVNPVVIIQGVNLGLAILLLIASILLIVGAAKRIEKMLLPWVAMAILNILLQLVSIILSVVFIFTENSKPEKFPIFVGVLEIILMIYCITVVMSLYKNHCYEIGETERSEVVRYDPVKKDVYQA